MNKEKISIMQKISNDLYNFSLIMLRKMNYHSLRKSIAFIRDNYEGSDLIGAEIGVRYGGHSLSILKHLPVKTLYLIDPQKGYEGIDGYPKRGWKEIRKGLRRNLRAYSDKLVFIEKFSEDAVDDVPDDMDFIYIDGNHDYAYIKKDVDMYYPKLKKGGVLCGHDFQIPDVARAVTELAKKYDLKVNANGYLVDWWIVKKEMK